MNFMRLKNRLLARAFTALPGLAGRWAESLPQDTGLIPWTEPRTPLAQAKVALITTGGVHLRRQGPFDMKDQDGDPTYREVPMSAAREDLTITHDYYNHAEALQDINLVLPMERLHALETERAVGEVHPVAFSFMGHIDGLHVDTLRRRTAPEVGRKLRAAGVDYALLVPA